MWTDEESANCSSRLVAVAGAGDESVRGAKHHNRSFTQNKYGHRTLCTTSVILNLNFVLHNWCNKGCGICYPVCGMMLIKEPLLLIGKSIPCSGGSGFPLSLSE